MEEQPKPNIINDQQLTENRNKLLKILNKAPIVGLYKNQDPSQWDNFFKFYISFILSQSGPRGDCSKKIRSELLLRQEEVNQVLKPFNFTAKDHIRDIWIKFKNYSPSPLYDQLLKLDENLIKNNDTLEKLKDNQSILYAKIKQGMKIKYTQQQQLQAEFIKEIERVKCNYIDKIAKMIDRKTEIMQILNNTAEYNDYIKIKDYMKNWFQQWAKADQNVGKQSENRGKMFEDKVLETAVPYIIQKCKQKIKGKLQIFTNAKWIPKNLGQIDIAIGYFDQINKKYKASILIQCKSRLFDLRYAFYQVNTEEIKKQNKNILSTSKGKVEVQQNSQYFLVTMIPEHQYLLPVQSSMKQALDKAIKNIPVCDIESQSLYKALANKFQNEESPLNWFLKADSKRIIILS